MLRKNNGKGLSLLQRFGLFFYQKKELTILYWLAIVIFGIVSYTTLLPRQGFPNVSVPVSVVTGTYFVNNKEQVDKEVAEPAANLAKSLQIVDDVTTESNNNFFVMVVSYKEGTTSSTGSQQVQQVIANANSLPSSASLQYQVIDAGRFEEQSDLLLAVYAKDTNSTSVDIGSYASKIAQKLTETAAIKDASYIEQYKTGTNPSSGETIVEQTSFDITGYKDGSSQIFLKDSALVGVRAAEGSDAFAVYDAVAEVINNASGDVSFADVDFKIVANFAEGITSQIESLQKSLLEGLVVVILVSFLLISWRAGVAIAISMTTVLLATVGLLHATGSTLNTITLFALILSLGLIVDDTTIMVEAIDAAKSDKHTKREIVAVAIKKVARASFAGTITTMLGFAPMLFIGGILGDFIRVLPITIIVALAMSLLISLTLVPFFARFLIHKSSKSKVSLVGRLEKSVSHRLSSLLIATKISKKRRFATAAIGLGLSGVFILSSFVYFGKLKFDIFPATKDSDALTVSVTLPPNTPLLEAKNTVSNIATSASDIVGSNFKRLSLQGTGSSTGASLLIDLVPYTSRDITAPQLIQQLEKELKAPEGAVVRVSQVDVGPPKEAFPFKIRIEGADKDAAMALANSLQQFLKDRTITRLNNTTAKITAAEVRNDAIRRTNSTPYIEVRASFSDTDVSALVTAAQKEVEETYTEEKLKTFGVAKQQVVFDFGSESDNQDSFKSMLVAFPLLLLAMYILLAVQFKSLLQPFLIFAAIPFSFFGVAAGLYYTNNPLSFFVMIGFFALIGIAVNNTILLTDFANQARAEGAGPTDAIATAVRARFRPLLATSLTSVVALIPLALSDPFWESLAYTLIFGLLSSTFLVIISFPYYYLLAEWLRQKMSLKRWKAKKS